MISVRGLFLRYNLLNYIGGYCIYVSIVTVPFFPSTTIVARNITISILLQYDNNVTITNTKKIVVKTHLCHCLVNKGHHYVVVQHSQLG